MASVHCRLCVRTFYSLTTLRRHQWSAHRDRYSNVGKVHPKKEVKLLEAPKDVIVRDIQQPVPPVDMSVTELLRKLTAQQEFLHDVVSLIEGMRNE